MQLKDIRRTVKVLPIELLYKLQHHSVDRTAPHGVSRRETFEPGGLAAVVLGFDSVVELFDNLDHQGVVLGHVI